ncbi:MAG: response regulator, partial [Myxococcota bacterium]
MATRVLLVDDSRFDRRMYGDFLRHGGCDVVTVTSGEEALEALPANAFDVVVADLVLPGLDGLGVLAAARQLDPDLGVLLITAIEDVETAVRAIKMGAFDYLVKPIAAEHLQRAVRRCHEYRGLLHENSELRRTVALTEAAARLVTLGDRNELCRALVDALVRERLGALAAVAKLLPDGSMELLHLAGLGSEKDDLRAAMMAALTASSRATAGSGLVDLAAVIEHDLGEGLLARVDPSNSAYVVGLFATNGGRPSELDRESLRFLSRQFSYALSALDRAAAVESLAFVDDLTKLYNMRYLRQALARQIELADTGHGSFSLMF